MASSELLVRSGRLIWFADRSLPRGRGPEGPCFQLANPSVRAAFRTPADRAAQDDCTSARDSLRPNARGSASATSRLNRYLWVPLRGCEVRLMLRPEQLLALHRQGRLRSSFHSHESPHQNVEHDYAGKSSISRGRTYTGWIRSLTGCTAFGAARDPGVKFMCRCGRRTSGPSGHPWPPKYGEGCQYPLKSPPAQADFADLVFLEIRGTPSFVVGSHITAH